MHRLSLTFIALACVAGCGGGTASTTPSSSGDSESGGSEEEGSESTGFRINDSTTAGDAHGDHPSEITADRTHAAMRLFVVDPDAGPISGVVIKMTTDGVSYYTGETDSVGYAEVLVPAGRTYEMEYLSLGRPDIATTVTVPEGPNQDIRLTLRRRRHRRAAPPPPAAGEPAPAPAPEPEPTFVLEGILFDSGAATIADESLPRLDRLVEYMTHRTSVRIRIVGHTDNVGNPRTNLALSTSRAQAVRAYVIEHGIDEARIEATGLGDAEPVAPNDTDEGRARNRRIEAIEIENE
jgi:outer membrane protein OmpA-like peptidoglycan-associated protein